VEQQQVGYRAYNSEVFRAIRNAIQQSIIALGSACELECQLSLALRLGFLREDQHRPVADLAAQTCKTLNGLIRALRKA
jgi:four helix bundle protein